MQRGKVDALSEDETEPFVSTQASKIDASEFESASYLFLNFTISFIAGAMFILLL